MSKKKKKQSQQAKQAQQAQQAKQAQEEQEKRFEDSLDELVRIMLITPGVTEGLLKNKTFVKEALLETQKAQKNKDDIKGLGDKYHVSSQEISGGLSEVEEVLTKILGDDQ